jgi:hypothetical protein
MVVLIMKKTNPLTFEEMTKPLKEKMEKIAASEDTVPDIVHKFRSSKTQKL